jgi:hypothetical protein
MGLKLLLKTKETLNSIEKWIEDLIDLLFQVDNDDFNADFTSNPIQNININRAQKGQNQEKKKFF